ncbi:MAG: hypothetical protein WC596_01410 [Candidatus Shapirobacteria bacterium]
MIQEIQLGEWNIPNTDVFYGSGPDSYYYGRRVDNDGNLVVGLVTRKGVMVSEGTMPAVYMSAEYIDFVARQKSQG